MTAATSSLATTISPTLRILYVDDEPDVRLIGRMGLRLDRGIEVRDVGCGADALSLLAEETWKPNLLLLDVMMPEMSGPQLLMAIRGNPSTRSLPVIFVTAKTGVDAREEYFGLGALGVIPKPYQVLHLASEVRAFMDKAKAGTHEHHSTRI